MKDKPLTADTIYHLVENDEHNYFLYNFCTFSTKGLLMMTRGFVSEPPIML